MNMKKKFKSLIFIIILMIPLLFLQSDDKELFMGLDLGDSRVKPNVMILMDTSGSMNTIIFYPRVGVDGMKDTSDDGFNGRIQYEGTITGYGTSQYWKTDSTGWHSQWVSGTNGYEDNYYTGVYLKDDEDTIYCGGNGQANFEVGDWIINKEHSAVARIKTKEYDSVVGYTRLVLEDREGTFPISGNVPESPYALELRTGCELRVVKLYGGLDHAKYETLYPLNYLKWVFLHSNEEQREAISHFSQYGTFDITDTETGKISNCSTSGTTYDQYTFTRIQVAREVACKVAEDSRYIVNLGLYKFEESYGGAVHDSLHDMSELNAMVDYKKKTYNTIEGEAWTPLAEALVDVWYYFRPGPASKPYMPVNMDTAIAQDHDIEWWCQQNYCIVMTDGESTQDRFTGDGRFTGSMFSSSTYPVKRTDPWEDWTDGWGDPDNNETNSGTPSGYNPDTAIYCPNYSCWLRSRDGWDYQGSDYLDDVAYFMAHSDLFPEYDINGDELYGDDPETGWPGMQSIYTYTIGFGIDNDMLRATAINGEGAYYTADNYEELVNAFKSIITSILLRNFAFSAITAPKKTATAANTDQTISYVGYFLPSQANSIWDGHLAAYELFDKWGFDDDGNGAVEENEYRFNTEEDCYSISGGAPCVRLIQLSDELLWDAAWAGKIPADRNLYTLKEETAPDTPYQVVAFEKANKTDFDDLLGTTDAIEQDTIIDKLNLPNLGDIFHSDVGFVGPPLQGKKYIPNINPLDQNGEPYETFYTNHANRRRVLYAGTNDGILHVVYADDSTHVDMREAGREIWGFIPDAILPTLKDIVIDSIHTYTVDGRMTVEDIFYKKGTDTYDSWATALGFGLRRGGNHYYQLDISDITNQPTFNWSFNHPTYSGQSWGKPMYGKVKLNNPDPSDKDNPYVDKWIVILTGGYAYNYENPNDLKGKALFIVDAADGSLLWMVGYDPTDGADMVDNRIVTNTLASNKITHLTKADVFNFPLPSALTAVDKDFDGFLDAVYFANTGGNLFKLNIKSPDMTTWEDAITLLYQTELPPETYIPVTYIQGIDLSTNTISVQSDKDFAIGDTIMGETSYAMAHVTIMDVNNQLGINMLGSGSFSDGENLLIKKYDPIFLSPAVAFDTCYNVWVAFGTGDRDRPRSNPVGGNFVAFKDDDSTAVRQIGVAPLDVDFDAYWSTCLDENNDPYNCLVPPDDTTTNEPQYYDAFYFSFAGAGEKLFDPEPLIIPDENLVPHIFFNTYTPPTGTYVKQENPCNVPEEGAMTIYDISIVNCGQIEGEKLPGRISGGGIYGDQHVMFIGTPEVGSTPPLEETESRRLPYPGGIVFWKEKKR